MFSFLAISLVTQAQTSSDSKTSKQFFTEAGGPGILFSANFDSRFKPNTRVGLGFRAGLGFTIADQTTITQQPGSGYPNYTYRTHSILTVPVGINYLFGKPASPNMFEVGAGFTLLSKKAAILSYNDYNEGNLMGHFEFMYRRQPVEGGFSWRIGFTPVINTDGDIFPFAAVGLGYAFK
jgi:hypothetical protein